METLLLEVDSRGVATLALNRPEKRNAMSAQMISELAETAQRLGKDPAVRVVVLAARGPVFCAGGDLAWMKEQMAASAAKRAAAARDLAMMLQTLNTMPKPLVGRVHGNAFGGGVGLMSVCDVVVSAVDASFGLTETRLGLIPATIGPYVVARIGEAGARRVFMSGRVFGSAEALALGLVGAVVEPAALDEAVEEQVRPYLDCAPGAVAEAKALVRRLGPAIDESTIAETIDALVARWESSEASEGITAFFEKRPPRWNGA